MKTKKTILPLIFIIVFVGSLIIPLNVSAESGTVRTSYDYANENNAIIFSNVWGTNATGYNSVGGQTFTLGSNCYLDLIMVQIGKQGSVNANFGMRIYATDAGTHKPTGEPLVTASNTYNFNQFPADPDKSIATFNFGQTYQLVASTEYAFVIYVINATLLDNSANMGFLYYDQTGTYSGGDLTWDGSGADWFYQSAYDVSFYLTGVDSPSPTNTPTPAPTATPANGSHWIWNGTDWVNDDNVVTDTTETLLPILIPIAVIMICAGVGAYFLGKWGFLLGLDVAVVILYVAAPTYMPLWGVILIGVGNIGVLLMTRGE